ncbi:phosphatase PAP2 family protein [Roseomonas sp. CAU 1739]|uniref:phosphatase PAP2 family protein n=1 Tax=Roseomonas sp. CAU 1739 TaxID=3140364 RepID=UPI00325A65F9
MRPIRAVAALGLAAMVVSLPAHAAEPTAPVSPGAGTWRTWVLSSGSQFRLPPPPDATATQAELAQLRGMVGQRDAVARERIAWWDAAAPSYRWNQIATEELLRANARSNDATRHLALLHTALADGMIATWDSKYAHNRPRPAAANAEFQTAIATPPSPSYPDEHAVAGAIAAAVLGEVFPQRAAEFARLAAEEAQTRLISGVAFPSDVAAGNTLGRQVAAMALERGARDRSNEPWTGSVPATPGSWTGTSPAVPQAANWVPWMLTSASEFRPPPPTAHDSPERAAELAAVLAFQRTPKTISDAFFWEYAVGGQRNFQYWGAHMGRLLLEYGQAANAPRVARAYALYQAAIYDAGVACWDAKYTYWTIRPGQLDLTFRTLFATPNHPSYPSAHSCFSLAATTVLGHFFPRDTAALVVLGREAGEARIWAGIHYRSDITAGQMIGERVAGRAIERARGDGADVAP